MVLIFSSARYLHEWFLIVCGLQGSSIQQCKIRCKSVWDAYTFTIANLCKIFANSIARLGFLHEAVRILHELWIIGICSCMCNDKIINANSAIFNAGIIKCNVTASSGIIICVVTRSLRYQWRSDLNLLYMSVHFWVILRRSSACCELPGHFDSR